MPYAPGVSFDSRPLYEGIAEAGRNVAGGIEKAAELKQEHEFLNDLGPYYLQDDPKKLENFYSGSIGKKRGLITAAQAKEAAQQRGQEMALRERGQDLNYASGVEDRAFQYYRLGQEQEDQRKQFDLSPEERAAYDKVGVVPLRTGPKQFQVGEPMQAKVKPPSETQVTFEVNAAMAAEKYADLEQIVSKHGNTESKFWGDPDVAAKLGSMPYELAILYAKIVDPASVAREGEVAAAQRYLIPMGLTVPNEVTLAAIKYQKEELERRLKVRAKAREGSPIDEVQASAPAGLSAGAPPPVSDLRVGRIARQNGKRYQMQADGSWKELQ